MLPSSETAVQKGAHSISSSRNNACAQCAAGGPGAPGAFAAGGGVGIANQVLLQMGVDSIPGSSDYQQVLPITNLCCLQISIKLLDFAAATTAAAVAYSTAA